MLDQRVVNVLFAVFPPSSAANKINQLISVMHRCGEWLQSGWFWWPVVSRPGGTGRGVRKNRRFWWQVAPERVVLPAHGFHSGRFWLGRSRTDGSGGKWLQNGRFWRPWPPERAVLAGDAFQNRRFWRHVAPERVVLHGGPWLPPQAVLVRGALLENGWCWWHVASRTGGSNNQGRAAEPAVWRQVAPERVVLAACGLQNGRFWSGARSITKSSGARRSRTGGSGGP